MADEKLFMDLVGCKPAGRHTEQHDVLFTIGRSLTECVGDIAAFWPEADGRLHIDAWREVTFVDGCRVKVQARQEVSRSDGGRKLFFINLGGYKRAEFDEFHYKMLAVAADVGEAVRKSKGTALDKHTGFPGAPSHVDDKYGVD